MIQSSNISEQTRSNTSCVRSCCWPQEQKYADANSSGQRATEANVNIEQDKNCVVAAFSTDSAPAHADRKTLCQNSNTVLLSPDTASQLFGTNQCTVTRQICRTTTRLVCRSVCAHKQCLRIPVEWAHIRRTHFTNTHTHWAGHIHNGHERFILIGCIFGNDIYDFVGAFAARSLCAIVCARPAYHSAACCAELLGLLYLPGNRTAIERRWSLSLFFFALSAYQSAEHEADDNWQRVARTANGSLLRWPQGSENNSRFYFDGKTDKYLWNNQCCLWNDVDRKSTY